MDLPYNMMLVCVRCSSTVYTSHGQIVVRSCVHSSLLLHLLYLVTAFSCPGQIMLYNELYTYYEHHVLTYLSIAFIYQSLYCITHDVTWSCITCAK